MLLYLNGDYLPAERASLSVLDRGFLFGDGIYEVTRVVGGVPFEEGRHYERLVRSLRGLRLAEAGAEPATLAAVSARLLRENDLLEGEATIYVQVTRGAAPRTHAFPVPAVGTTVFVSTARFVPNAQMREKGVAVITTPDIRWARCDLKTVNLLPNVLAKQAAVDAGAFEAIFVRDGVVTEGAHTNLFGVVDGVVRTYPRCNYILGGITRDVVIELAAEAGIPLREEPLLADDLARAEELFITGTTTDVTSVVQVDGRPVAAGRPGPVARRLYELLAARMRAGAASATTTA
ncbi:MAG: aminotransferase class IV [Gemmatimonadaceae bacterium]